MNHKAEGITEHVDEELREVVARKLAVFEQIRALKAENRDLRDKILSSGRLNSTAIAVAVMCW
jgi:hypothetical protein